MWKTEKSFTTRDINNGYFLVSFEDENDMINIYQEGPWMVSDRYLVVQRWRLNFDPWNAELHKKIVIWLRIPLLPLEFFNAASFQRIGSLIGRTLKIDRVTYASERGRFARICVEIDLNKKLRSSFNLFGTRRRIEYEGLHLICFCCGVYGYHRDVCPERETHVVSNNNQAPNSTQEGSQEFSATHEQTRRYAESEQASINVEDGTAGEKRPRMVMESPTAAMGGAQPQKEGLGVWNLVQRSRRRLPGNTEKSGGVNHVAKIMGRSHAKERNPKGRDVNIDEAIFQEAIKAVDVEAMKERTGSFGKELTNNKRWVPVTQKKTPKGAEVLKGKENTLRKKSIGVGPPQRHTQEERGHFLRSPNPFQCLGDAQNEEPMEEECGLLKDNTPETHSNARLNVTSDDSTDITVAHQN
ncbi:uncharacterized protein LOC114735545 [Neltuma alba]|uniref:uncharacterized protein LOC114735545 n=1 Tax=Neltuma alba TaxID=207710 RepID=UPI0010A3191D|nr:uncharacterized protein LOC114735545 [Prosopis alba]